MLEIVLLYQYIAVYYTNVSIYVSEASVVFWKNFKLSPKLIDYMEGTGCQGNQCTYYSLILSWNGMVVKVIGKLKLLVN